jgi:hypothetical protein
MAACVKVNLGPACIDIEGVRAGDRNTVTITLHQGGVPLDLTGLTLTSQVRKKATDVDPPALTAEITVVDAPNGKATLRWPGDDVRALVNGSAKWAGVWDLQVASGPDDPTTVVAGKWSAETDVTR